LKIKIHEISAAIIVLLLLCSCSRSYTGQFFSFPPGSKPHENDWTYLCQVIYWAPLGKKGTDKGKRKIQVIITDKNNVLREEFELESASIESKIQWENLEGVTLDLYERGNQFAEDEYNNQLLKEGPRHLITLSYTWDGKKYIKNETEQAH
jgi:hypothetical protein